ncbi:nicotinate-nucleotide--dimethylbenzimidazole phosphoribosyltransferase, partial [uncultured Roseovarius sp.]|uniref:nicotinate-nucleotide--dimethylbenzimidazole phosphoribosyltransferase n=1 Tax=uncultured Roseovarius sp. TaxID=293344 RepID=UPI00261CC19A
MTRAFSSLSDFAALLRDLPGPDTDARSEARARDGHLTKPPGALGRLEDLAIWYCGWRGDPRARVTTPQVVVFAGNHGVVAQGVSAFPAEVTAQMVANFAAGGAAVNQLARHVGARMTAHALDLDHPTGDISCGPAMTEAEMLTALQTGWDAVDADCDLLVVGEMGIGNTTSAAAIALALHGGDAAGWTGRGTGLADEAVARK